MKRYAGFLSYSREGDSKLAVALQRGIERFGSSWRQARVVRIFRDDASLSANTGLWSSIENALGSSSWFVLLASPEAATSKWVNRELEWWLTNNSPDRILLVLTSGELIWDEETKDFDQTVSTAVPPTLRGVFAEEPRYVDARWSRSDELVSDVNPKLNEAIADIAATIRGIPKDELVGEAVRQQRRTRRIVRAVGVGFAALFAAVVVAAIVALNQRSEAKRQAKTSLTRQLAATSDNLAEQDLDVSLLMAVQGFETEPSSTTLGALIRADTASPQLVRFLHAGSEVAQIAAGGNGEIGYAGLEDGAVLRFSFAEPDGGLEEVMQLDARIQSLSVSDDGGTVAASDGKQAFVWSSDRGQQVPLLVPSGFKGDRVAVSPSGETVVVHGDRGVFEKGEPISVFAPDGTELYPPRRLSDESPVDELILTSDEELTIFTYGFWEERRLSDWSLGEKGGLGLGAQELGGYPSADGRLITATIGLDTTPVWEVGGAADHEEPEYTAEIDLRVQPIALALSPEGKSLVAAESGVIHVAPIAPPGQLRPSAARLVGGGTVNAEGVRFAGESRIVSAAGERIVLWDLRQLDRLAKVSRAPLGSGCNACPPPRIAVSGSGEAVAAAIDGGSFDTSALVAPISGNGTTAGKTVELPSGQFARPVWIDGGPEVAFPYIGEIDGSVAGDGIHAWRFGNVNQPITATGPGPDPGTVVVVDTEGGISVRDGTSGDVVREVAGIEGLGRGDSIAAAAVAASGTLVAALHEEELTITDLAGGEPPPPVNLPGAVGVSFAGDRLLVKREDNAIEIHDPRAPGKAEILVGDISFFAEPAGSSDGDLLARPQSDGAVALVDLDDRTTLGTLASPDADTSKTSVAFSEDGKTIVALNDDYSEAGDYVVVRDISGDALVESACETAGRPLTEEEWRRLVGVELPERLACEP